MPKVTGKYETIFLINATLTEEAIAALVEKFRSLIAENGTLEKIDEWGKRRMAYPINDMPDAYYVLAEFESKADFPAELDRIFHITDGIMRSIIVAK